MIAANIVAKKLRQHSTLEINQFSYPPPRVKDRSTKQNPHNQQPHIARSTADKKSCDREARFTNVRKIAFPHLQHRNEEACLKFGLFTHSSTSTKFKIIIHF
jgi:hypothetical protein